MATFTRLDDRDFAALGGTFELGAIQAWRPIAAGTINSNFEIHAGAGRFFVRVNEGKSEADVAWEAALVADLAAAGVSTPPARLTRDGDPFARHPVGDTVRLISVFPWIDGHHLGAGEVTPAATAAVGTALARLHLASAAIPPARHRAGRYTYGHIKARFASFAESRDPSLAHAIALIADEIAELDAQGALRAALPRGIIHGDLFRDNVLFDGGRVVAVIDFEQAAAGAFLYDLAVGVNDWCWRDASFASSLVDAMLAGYQRERPLTDLEQRMFPVEARAAAMRFTVTRITDVHLAGIEKPDKDFRDYLARLEALRALPVSAGP